MGQGLREGGGLVKSLWNLFVRGDSNHYVQSLPTNARTADGKRYSLAVNQGK